MYRMILKSEILIQLIEYSAATDDFIRSRRLFEFFTNRHTRQIKPNLLVQSMMPLSPCIISGIIADVCCMLLYEHCSNKQIMQNQ